MTSNLPFIRSITNSDWKSFFIEYLPRRPCLTIEKDLKKTSYRGSISIRMSKKQNVNTNFQEVLLYKNKTIFCDFDFKQKIFNGENFEISKNFAKKSIF